ncbi:MAG TPA: class I SAM-dependent methyltransferase [Methylocella sp.]|nr:class I SAM-dependent methyltransferase [Methylocella sp.]
MKSIKRFWLADWFGRGNSLQKHPSEQTPSPDFGAMTAVERQCYVSLAKALGKQPVSEARPVYVGTANTFSSKIADLRASLGGIPSSTEGSDFLFESFYSLCDRLARDEEDFQVECENERSMIAKLYQASKTSISYCLMPQFYMTRILSKMNYGNLDIAQPSLDVGTGDGVTARFVFEDKRISAGSDLFIHDLIEAKRNNSPFDDYMAFDATNVPFADGTFGTVVSMNTVYHAADKIAAISEMARVLAPGGTLCFDDIQSNVVTERPFLRAIKDVGVFPKSGDEFVRSILKPQRYLGPGDYCEILQGCGCDEVEVTPFMSLPLYKVVYFFYDLENFFGMNTAAPSERRVMSLMAF